MESKKYIKLLIIVVIIFISIFEICKYTNIRYKKLNLDEAKYILSLSGIIKNEDQDYILVITKDDKIKSKTFNNTIVVENSFMSNKNIYFLSRPKNSHYIINSQGYVIPLHFETNLYSKNAYIGLLFASTNNNVFMAGMNVGTTPKGYLNYFLYKTSSEKKYKDISYYDKILCSAVYNKKSIFHILI